MWCAVNLPLFTSPFSSPSTHGGIFVVIGYAVLIGYSFMFVCKYIKNTRIQLGVFFFMRCNYSDIWISRLVRKIYPIGK